MLAWAITSSRRPSAGIDLEGERLSRWPAADRPGRDPRIRSRLGQPGVQGYRRTEFLPTPTTGVEMVPHGQRIEVRIDGKLRHRVHPRRWPPSRTSSRLLGPSGALMTRSFPMKKVEGEKTTTPTSGRSGLPTAASTRSTSGARPPGTGGSSGLRVPRSVSGSAMGLIRTTDDRLAPPTARRPARTSGIVRIFATKKSRILDFDITLKATEGPVTFGDTKQGMFGFPGGRPRPWT